MTTVAVILAAGYGTRMKSKLPKVLHPLAGRPLVEWTVLAGQEVGDLRPVVVIGHGADEVRTLLGDRVQYAVQDDLLGTGHAVMQAQPILSGDADQVIVLYADMPLLQASTLRALEQVFCSEMEEGNLAMALLTIERADAQGFGRIIRDQQGNITAIREEVDCTAEELQICELNPGIYCFNGRWLWENLSRLQVSSKGEYFLTDMVAIAVQQGKRIVSMSAPMEEVYGINTRSHLAQAAGVMRQRILERHMLAGVTIVDPQTTYIDDMVQIGQDTVILPGCHLQGQTIIGADCVIGPNSRLFDTAIADNCKVEYSVLEEARMDTGSEIGPFGHLRKGAHLGPDVHMGNFGEVKNSYLGPGTKMGHFSYIGDATVGANVNVGAGTITCNFDGVKKNRTVLHDDVFLGSDTLLIAPVEIGEKARTGAGSVVTHDVEENVLVYGVPARPAPSHIRSPVPPEDGVSS